MRTVVIMGLYDCIVGASLAHVAGGILAIGGIWLVWLLVVDGRCAMPGFDNG